jgi:hypothetical protein
VSETVAAALLLISALRPLQEIVARLTADEFKQVVEIVGRWPDHFRPGTLVALKDLSRTASPEPSAGSVATGAAPSQPTARTNTSAVRARRTQPARLRAEVPRSGAERGPAAFGVVLDSAAIRWAIAEGVSETVIAAVLLLHERSVDEIVAKLEPGELEQVIKLVGRSPSCYPPGTLDALKGRRPAPAPEPVASGGNSCWPIFQD